MFSQIKQEPLNQIFCLQTIEPLAPNLVKKLGTVKKFNSKNTELLNYAIDITDQTILSKLHF